MDVQEEEHMEIVNENGGQDVDSEVEQHENEDMTPPPSPVDEDQGSMQVEENRTVDENANVEEEDDDERTKDEDDEEKTKEEELNDDIRDEEDLDADLYDSDLDLDNLEGRDPSEIEKKKQELLEKRDKLIAFLESKGADPEELLQLGLEDQTSTPSSSRQKRKRTSKRLSESPSSSYSLRDTTKSRRTKPVRKTPKKETPEIAQDELKGTSPAENKRERTTWTLAENKQLLKILESGHSDIQYIYKEMSRLPGRRKSVGHIRNKKSNLLQKAALKGTNMIDILREDILKSEELEGRTRRQSKDSDVYNNNNNETSFTPLISNAEFSELKNLLISGLLENQRQIALLRRDFAHYRGLPIPPDVADILSDDEQDDTIQEQAKTTPNSGRKTLVIKKNKQTTDDVNKVDNEQVTIE